MLYLYEQRDIYELTNYHNLSPSFNDPSEPWSPYTVERYEKHSSSIQPSMVYLSHLARTDLVTNRRVIPAGYLCPPTPPCSDNPRRDATYTTVYSQIHDPPDHLIERSYGDDAFLIGSPVTQVRLGHIRVEAGRIACVLIFRKIVLCPPFFDAQVKQDLDAQGLRDVEDQTGDKPFARDIDEYRFASGLLIEASFKALGAPCKVTPIYDEVCIALIRECS